MVEKNKIPLVLSIDLDEWCHIRWISGSNRSRWDSPENFFCDVYGNPAPPKAIYAPTRQLLRLFKQHNITVTFFITGQVVRWYPDLVQEVADAGHELGSHSLRHIDLERHTQDSFVEELRISRNELEQFTDQPIRGFRAPNLLVDHWMRKVLEDEGFTYDSSICPARALQGKYGAFEHLPNVPYRTTDNSFEQGNSDFWELPVSVFPGIRLPGASGLATRIFGKWWTDITLRSATKEGIPMFYFHPWECDSVPENFPYTRLYERLFFRHTGDWMFKTVSKYVGRYQAISCYDAIQRLKA